jgi:hypothetical protein
MYSIYTCPISKSRWGWSFERHQSREAIVGGVFTHTLPHIAAVVVADTKYSTIHLCTRSTKERGKNAREKTPSTTYLYGMAGNPQFRRITATTKFVLCCCYWVLLMHFDGLCLSQFLRLGRMKSDTYLLRTWDGKLNSSFP